MTWIALPPWLLAALLLWSLWLAVASASALIALWRARASAKAHHAASSDAASHTQSHAECTLIRPCAGAEPGLELRLRHCADVNTVRFVVHDPADSAAEPAQNAASWLSARGVDAQVVYSHAAGHNHKAAQLAMAVQQVQSEFIACVDSDVELKSHRFSADLRQLAHDEHLGALWYPVFELGAWQQIGDVATAGALSASLHAFALLGQLDPHGFVGKAALLRCSALRKSGGFAALVNVLGEDMQLAENLRNNGYVTRLTAGALAAHTSGRSWRAATERFARWIWVIRAQRLRLLLSYPLLLAALPMQLATACVVLALAPAHARAMAATSFAVGLLVALGTRMLLLRHLTQLAARLAPARAQLAWLGASLLGDFALLAGFAASLAARTVTWRGEQLAIGKSGKLTARSRSPADSRGK